MPEDKTLEDKFKRWSGGSLEDKATDAPEAMGLLPELDAAELLPQSLAGTLVLYFEDIAGYRISGSQKLERSGAIVVQVVSNDYKRTDLRDLILEKLQAGYNHAAETGVEITNAVALVDIHYGPGAAYHGGMVSTTLSDLRNDEDPLLTHLENQLIITTKDKLIDPGSPNPDFMVDGLNTRRLNKNVQSIPYIEVVAACVENIDSLPLLNPGMYQPGTLYQ